MGSRSHTPDLVCRETRLEQSEDKALHFISRLQAAMAADSLLLFSCCCCCCCCCFGLLFFVLLEKSRLENHILLPLSFPIFSSSLSLLFHCPAYFKLPFSVRVLEIDLPHYCSPINTPCLQLEASHPLPLSLRRCLPPPLHAPLAHSYTRNTKLT